ncbi:MAG TPA: hypothetical protein VIJ40_02290 [Acidimicrobiales bacterium]
MAVKQHFKALVLAFVAFALTVTGVVIAATDSNTSSLAKDPLLLHNYPPRTANLLVTLSTGASFGLSANVAVNFDTNNVDAIVRFPLVVTTAAVELRLLNKHLYARSADVSSGPWLSLAFKTPALFGVALEITKPDIKLISGFTTESITKSGYSTTYTFYRDHVALQSLLGSPKSKSTSTLGSVRWSITVGSGGEVTQSTIRTTSKKSSTTLSVTVLSFNKPVKVVAPSAKDTTPISSAALGRLLNAEKFTSFLIPKDLTTLSQAQVS